jgi:hypothetical protein
MKKLFILFAMAAMAGEAWAQDPQFSQFYAAPLYHNPAFTGAAHKGRLVGNYRNQWPSIPGAFVTTSFSFDNYFKSYNSGFGLVATRDQAGTGGLSTTSLSLNYAYEINFSSQWNGRAGLAFGYSNRNVDFTKLTFRDQLNANFVPIPTSDPAQASFNRAQFFDISSGFLLYSRYVWIGTSVMHMNQPDQSLLGQTAKLPMRITLMAGAKIPLQKRMYGSDYGSKDVEKSISPSILYKRQGDFQQLDLGAYLTVKPLIVGMWYRGLPSANFKKGLYKQDALVWLLGFKHDFFSVGYSYDLTISKLGPGTAGSHEISISYEFDNPKRRKKKVSPIPCPKF